MPKGTQFSNDFLKLVLNGTAIANIADNAGSSPLTNLYLALHTADPGVGGSQTTSEASYTGYARVAVPRSTSGFTAASGGVSSLLRPFRQALAGREQHLSPALAQHHRVRARSFGLGRSRRRLRSARATSRR
jgi:hypothetical protein